MRSVCQGFCISTIYARSYLICIKTKWGKYVFHNTFSDEETEASRSGARIQIQTCLDLKDNLSPTILTCLFFPLEFGNKFRLKPYLITLYNLQSLETNEGSEILLIYMFMKFSLSKNKWRRKKKECSKQR